MPFAWQQSDLVSRVVVLLKIIAMVVLCGLLHAYILLAYKVTPTTNNNNIIIFLNMS
jgi:hypothetical protein